MSGARYAIPRMARDVYWQDGGHEPERFSGGIIRAPRLVPVQEMPPGDSRRNAGVFSRYVAGRSGGHGGPGRES
ncbi:MAG: hypothetical protein LZF60_170051 [Nitrospira sp.]|nr:MAG: hypothetical protein LZF60_170051 [Nitrospira sp.]